MALFNGRKLKFFEFMGSKKAISPCLDAKNLSEITSSSSFLIKNLPYPSQIFRKPRLRGLRFNVSLRGELEILANKSINDFQIISLLKPHQPWIQRQMVKNSLIRARFPQKLWKSGETFFLNGKKLSLIFLPSSTKKAHIRFMKNSFEYFYPLTWHEYDLKEFHKKLHQNFLYFFRLKASQILNKKVFYWSQRMQLFPKSVAYRNQKSRWGSCSSLGVINLNWRLIAFDGAIQDYVIVHELAHLKHQNHFKQFWDLVESFLPDRKFTQKKLNNTALIADCYAAKSELYQNNPVYLKK